MQNDPSPTSSVTQVAFVDFKDGMRPSQETESLGTLIPGAAPILYDHAGKRTNFSTWIATRRNRMGKNFKYDRFVRVTEPNGDVHVTAQELPENQYYIWVEN